MSAFKYVTHAGYTYPNNDIQEASAANPTARCSYLNDPDFENATTRQSGTWSGSIRHPQRHQTIIRKR